MREKKTTNNLNKNIVIAVKCKGRGLFDGTICSMKIRQTDRVD